MGKQDILRKKPNAAISKTQHPTFEETVDNAYMQTKKQVDDGLSRTTASTGKPISELYGGAKRIAQVSNIGGGSKATGGNGIDGGLDALTRYAQAQTAKTFLDNSKQKKLTKK